MLGGLVVGLATLSRSDGVLLGLPFALVAAHDLWRRRPQLIGLPAALVCVLLFALVVGPWLYRQLEVFGSILPAGSSGRMLWLTNYQQLFSFSNPPTPEEWLAQGLGPLLQSRIDGVISAVGLFATLPLVVVLAPLAVVGAWVRRSDHAFAPFLVYALALFAVMGLLFAVVVPHGTFIHSAAALVPHTFLLVTAGVAATVRWVAARRKSWDIERATAVFTIGAVGVAVLGAAVQTVSTIGQWSAVRRIESQLAGSLRSAPVGDRVMSANPGAYYYLTGHGGIVTPNDPLDVIEAAMRAYDVRWLVLERVSIMPALARVLSGEVRPSWLSQPIAVVPLLSGATVAKGAPGATPTNDLAGALYAVCLSANDTRCAP